MTATQVAPVAHPDVAARTERGRAARKRLPRATLAAWAPPADRPDPVALLEAQEATRVPELVEIRHQRMLASSFAFYRGAAVVMAADEAAAPDSGLHVQCCGDAHLANFGGFGSPERLLVFDINDFDETSRGPFEWDVKRLAASLEIAARSRGFGAKASRAIVEQCANEYRLAMRDFASMRNLDVWYAHLDVEALINRYRDDVPAADIARLEQVRVKAQARDSLKAFAKLTHVVDGEIRISSDPPLLVPIEDLAEGMDPDLMKQELREVFRAYRHSLQPDRRHLLEGYRLVDLAHKVVGVGSVGTRCWIALLLGKNDQDPLFLQIKEASQSVLEPYAGRSPYANHGRRVVEGQRLLQASSDILLGWLGATGIDGLSRDFYVRQLWDWKLSPNIDVMSDAVMRVYGRLCGWTLARAHARSGDRVAIAAYLGSSDGFERAIRDFAVTYADQNERDFQTARAAWTGDPGERVSSPKSPSP